MIVFFDGICNLCQHSVHYLIQHDKNKTLKFASLQGENAKKMLEEANGNVDAKTFQEKGCIVGVNNASFEVAKGEMLV
ncbi:MAG: DCC1-like thiol-disulfide oxidoreductase family protein, partial [Flavobacteriaceae bacterium]